MDTTKFTAPTGKLVPVANPLRGKDWAFIPDELPPKWQFNPQLWPLLAEAKSALGTLNGIGQTLPDPNLLLRPLQSREAIASSRIEGTFVTPEQLLLYELDPREPKSADDQRADWLEVFNYGNAQAEGCKALETLPICNRVIRSMHKTLMAGVRGRNKSPGEFRRVQVEIGSSGRFIPPPGLEVDRLMDNLEGYINVKDSGIDPLVRSYLIHYQFEAVHPFEDGNGRVGRALISLMTYKWLDHFKPWLYLSAFFERYKDEYIENLFNVSAKGDWSAWVEFCLRGTIQQAHDSISRCHKFKRLREKYFAQMPCHSARSCQIIEGLFTTPIVTIPVLADRYKIAYHTAQTDVTRLVAAGILTEAPKLRPRTFFSKEIMKIAYSESGIDEPANTTASAAPSAPSQLDAQSQPAA